ncbi:DUF2514 family protein [Niveibacterium terrae]|uniref:DUF2514 family protein n=1 Tax=Niveibacterium terrae TaxID=3373598 RepID=UPI003A8EA682
MNPIPFLKLVPLKDWLYIGLAVLIAVAGALIVHHERELGAARAEAQLQHERAAVAQAGAKQAIDSLNETKRRTGDLLEIAHAAQESAQRAADSAAADHADRRAFGVQLDAYVRGRAVPGNPAFAAGSAPASDAALVLARLLERADARAEDLARLSDQRGNAGITCERSYDALTQKH